MQSNRGQPDHRVSGNDALPLRKRVDVHDSDDRSGEIEVVRSIDSGHLGGLAAEQRAIVTAARLGAARHDLGGHFGIEPAHCEIIQEEQRRRVGDEDVVHAVVDEISADLAVTPQLRGNHDLRADAVRRGDQGAALVAREPEQPGKPSDGVKLIGVAPASQHLAIARDGFAAGGDAHARAGVAIGRVFWLGHEDSPSFAP